MRERFVTINVTTTHSVGALFSSLCIVFGLLFFLQFLTCGYGEEGLFGSTIDG